MSDQRIDDKIQLFEGRRLGFLVLQQVVAVAIERLREPLSRLIRNRGG